MALIKPSALQSKQKKIKWHGSGMGWTGKNEKMTRKGRGVSTARTHSSTVWICQGANSFLNSVNKTWKAKKNMQYELDFQNRKKLYKT